MIKFEFSNENYDLGKFESSITSVTASLYSKDFLGEMDGDINVEFLIVYNEMYQYLKICFISEPVLSRRQCWMLQKHAWVKDLFGVQDRSVYFSVTA